MAQIDPTNVVLNNNPGEKGERGESTYINAIKQNVANFYTLIKLCSAIPCNVVSSILHPRADANFPFSPSFFFSHR